MTLRSSLGISDFRVSLYRVPTETPEADGTLPWESTTLLLVELQAGKTFGMGYSYGHAALKPLTEDLITQVVRGKNALLLPQIWSELCQKTRNDGEGGLCAMAISAIDTALWDLKAKLLGVSLSELLGQLRPRIAVYGSGGFTNYSDAQFEKQFQAWLKAGITKFKMKVGTDAARDPERVRFARKIIGDQAELFVDANGAYDFQTALKLAVEFSKSGVTWFEQPIDPFDLEGMRNLKNRLPPGMNLTSGEYIYDLSDLDYALENQAQDIMQLDASRCKGISGFIKGAFACEMKRLPLSAHCAPSLHVALGCSLSRFQHLEYFYDHARVENLLFFGASEVRDGFLTPDLNRLGLGIELKPEAEKYRL